MELQIANDGIAYSKAYDMGTSYMETNGTGTFAFRMTCMNEAMRWNEVVLQSTLVFVCRSVCVFAVCVYSLTMYDISR